MDGRGELLALRKGLRGELRAMIWVAKRGHLRVVQHQRQLYSFCCTLIEHISAIVGIVAVNPVHAFLRWIQATAIDVHSTSSSCSQGQVALCFYPFYDSLQYSVA
jgi:hypothetical protein